MLFACFPYFAMADQNGSINLGASPMQNVAGAYFPWVPLSTLRKYRLGLVVFFGLLSANTLVAAKSVLIGTQQVGSDWIVFVRTQPAYFLICGYGIMALSNLVITCSLWSQSTGLRWHPISLLDFITLFAKCNALDCFFSRLEYTSLLSADRWIPQLGYRDFEKESTLPDWIPATRIPRFTGRC